MATTWAPTIEHLDPATNPSALTEILPLLVRLVSAYGQSNVAGLLGVDKSTVSNWMREKREIGFAMRGRIVDVHDVLTRAHQVFNPILAVRWLLGHEPFLGGARPIDVLGFRGASPVIDALDAISSGGYA